MPDALAGVCRYHKGGYHMIVDTFTRKSSDLALYGCLAHELAHVYQFETLSIQDNNVLRVSRAVVSQSYFLASL